MKKTCGFHNPNCWKQIYNRCLGNVCHITIVTTFKVRGSIQIEKLEFKPKQSYLPQLPLVMLFSILLDRMSIRLLKSNDWPSNQTAERRNLLFINQAADNLPAARMTDKVGIYQGAI